MSITIDYANCLSDRVGADGVTPSALDTAAAELSAITESMESSRGTGWERWRTLPFDPARSAHLDAVSSVADRLRPDTENLLVLGIGGSALGSSALQSALNPLTWNLLPRPPRDGPRMFVLDNVDPHLVMDTLKAILRDDPKFEKTVVNVVTKSGETAETAAQFLILRSILEDSLGAAYAERVVAVTDPSRGTMREICEAEGYATLPVPDGVGGRFSVLSPVGLFSAAMCGIDIEALLDGAAAMDDRCRQTEVRENPAATLAWILISLARAGKPVHVLMPYANALAGLADWYRQLWAESLGKRYDVDGNEVFAGPTPVAALGATDQHSQIQLYREGPNDKVIGFVEVAEFDRDLDVPDDLDADALSYLHGASLSDLLHAEKRATEYALVESGRPNYTIRFPRLDAHSVGAFIQLWQVTTAYAGRLLNIDPYDQPAVETGKKATFGLMGREGFEDWRKRVDERLTETDRIA